MSNMRWRCRKLAALLLTVVAPSPCLAQEQAASVPPDTVLDPASPMADLPDIGVAWPDMAESAASQNESAANSAADTGAEERRYSIVIEGLERLNALPVKQRFDALSALRQGESKPANTAQIDRRTREDRDLLEQILRASGHYDPQVDAEVEGLENGAVRVRFNVAPGPQYRFQSVAVDGLDSTGEKAGELGAAFGVTKDDAIDADDVLAGRDALQKKLRDSGYPFAKVADPEIVVDHDTRSGTLAMTVETGGERRFGEIRITTPNPPFDADHIARIARFKSGERFDQSGVDDLRRALVATGIVGAVDIKAVQGASDMAADIAVGLEPAPLRTLAGEAGYGTGEGFRVEGSWTHRNLIRPEGAVTIRGVAGTREQLAGLVLHQSNFRRRDHVLNARLQASNVNRNAFDARTVEVGLALERESNIIWQKRWTWSVGAELLATDESDVTAGGIGRRLTYFIGALPMSLGYDKSNDLLDPTRGFRLGLRVAPEASLRNGTNGYLRVQMDGSAYVPAGDRVVLAGRARLGSIIGASTMDVAPSRRFYAGGGGSVRGFGYQEIGPRDAFNDPIGGRSLAEFSLEARVRFGDFGIVPFVDGGSIYDSRFPRLSDFRYGAGLGVRYHSSFGPIRLDVGTPINPRKGDAPVTVFVSLGQAF